MKKVPLFVLLIIICMCPKVHGITEDFKYMIQEVGIPRYNVKNQEINEDIYHAYNLFVYSSPIAVNTSEQRWKSLSNGRWTYKGGAYKGSGNRGEYAILGTDYSSNIIYNYYFPLDRVTSTPILNWQFLKVSGALESWNNANRYYSQEQLEYAKQANWWFQNIQGGANDPYDQREYNLNALKVGLEKCRLEIPATWKTKGSIFTNRRTESGGIAWANFAIEPMAADAKVESNIQVNKDYTLDSETDEILIPIEYGASIKELSKYAKPEHVRDVVSKLYINEKEVASVSGSKTTNVGNKYMFVVTRNLFPQNKQHQIKVKVYSYVKTEFSSDGLLKDIKEVTLTVKVENKKIRPITNNELKVLGKNFNNWVVSPLAQNIDTIKNNSLGITEAGRCLVVKSNLNTDEVNKHEIEQYEVYIDGVKNYNYKPIEESKSSMAIILQLPQNLSSTLYGIKSLREEEHNYFKVDLDEMLKRKNEPHTIEIAYVCRHQVYKEILRFDTVDDYISNMNMNIVNHLNTTKSGNEINLESWIK